MIVGGIAEGTNDGWGQIDNLNERSVYRGAISCSKSSAAAPACTPGNPFSNARALTYIVQHESAHLLGLHHPHDGTVSVAKAQGPAPAGSPFSGAWHYYYEMNKWQYDYTASPTTYGHTYETYEVVDQDRLMYGHTAEYLKQAQDWLADQYFLAGAPGATSPSSHLLHITHVSLADRALASALFRAGDYLHAQYAMRNAVYHAKGFMFPAVQPHLMSLADAAKAAAQPTDANIRDGHEIFVITPQPVYGSNEIPLPSPHPFGYRSAVATVAGAERHGVDSGVQLAEVVASIALAADLGLGQPLEHVLRTCVVAMRFADHLGLSQEDRDATYWVALFTTAGCTGVSFELAEVFGDDIQFRKDVVNVAPSTFDIMRFIIGRAGSGRGAITRARIKADLLFTRMSAVERSFLAHCAISAQLTNRLGLGELVETCLYQTFAQYDGKGIPRHLGGEELLAPIQISNMAVQAVALCRDKGLEAAVDFTGRCSGKVFDPKLVSEFCPNADRLLAVDEDGSTWDAVISAQPGDRGPLTEEELDQALALIGDYADLKSPWFTGHSRGVATLAVAAAHTAGLPQSDVKTLERAAWVHDIGRNGVPNTIWDKPGPLTDLEMEKVRLHAYYTDRVLHNAGRLGLLASIASSAHERSGGSGYPRGIAGATIPLLGRFLEAADSYHAMIEDRPHRRALSREDAAKELRRGARQGEYDGVAVDAVLSAAGHEVRRKPSTPAGLTPREVEVLVLASKGGTTRAVAHALGIAPKTAGNHIERIYTKIGVNSRAEAAMFAMQNGLLQSWDSAEA